jgi:hypothetical protein
MSWYPDMGTATLAESGDYVRAVGWLSAVHPFTQGEVGTEFLQKLKQFAKLSHASAEALHWPTSFGSHNCELCRHCMANGDIGVPMGELLFVAPKMITHYVEVHQYRPPDEFVSAVMQSPLPGTDAYRTAVQPILRLKSDYLARNYPAEYQQLLEWAGNWAVEHGGTDEAFDQARSKYFGDTPPDICQRIRRVVDRRHEEGKRLKKRWWPF